MARRIGIGSERPFVHRIAQEPTVTPPPDDLTNRQQAILDEIHRGVHENGLPPTIRELCEVVGLKSPSSVKAQLETLEAKGYIRRDEGRSRAIHLLFDPVTQLSQTSSPGRSVPLVGEIAAGAPIVADERVEQVFSLPPELVGDGTLFMLRVRGESMIDAGVFDGDYVVIRQISTVSQGEMAAVLVDGEATVKFWRRTKDGRIFLDPANERYEPIELTADVDSSVMGKVVTVLRSFA
jgi:repressor LexA